MAAKLNDKTRARLRDRILKILTTLSNEYPENRAEMAKMLWPDKPQRWARRMDGSKGSNYLYKAFTADELSIIEAQALAIRRKKYSLMLAKVDDGVLKRGAEGDPTAAKLAYQRFEGWEPSEKKKIDLTGEIRAKVFKELLDELNAENQGFSDLFPGGGVTDVVGKSGTGDDQ